MRNKFSILFLALMVSLFLVAVYAGPTIYVYKKYVAAGTPEKILITGSPGEKCVIEIRNPLNNPVYVREFVLNATGQYLIVYDTPSGCSGQECQGLTGEYKIYVTCEVTGNNTGGFEVYSLITIDGEAHSEDLGLFVSQVAAIVFIALGVGVALFKVSRKW